MGLERNGGQEEGTGMDGRLQRRADGKRRERSGERTVVGTPTETQGRGGGGAALGRAWKRDTPK